MDLLINVCHFKMQRILNPKMTNYFIGFVILNLRSAKRDIHEHLFSSEPYLLNILLQHSISYIFLLLFVYLEIKTLPSLFIALHKEIRNIDYYYFY